MPIRFMPLVSDIIANAPTIDPVTLPTPPDGDAPPTKAAAIASNSKRVHAVVVADLKRDANNMPDRAARRPIEAKTT